MKMNPRQLYGIAAVLATAAAILQLIAREWFRGGTAVLLAGMMTLAAIGFPERSPTNKRIYSTLLGVLIVLLIIQIYSSLT